MKEYQGISISVLITAEFNSSKLREMGTVREMEAMLGSVSSRESLGARKRDLPHHQRSPSAKKAAKVYNKEH